MPSTSTHSRLSYSKDNFHSNFTGHHSPAWISFDTIIPTLGSTISAWIGRQLDHHVFESTILISDIAQVVSARSTVHLIHTTAKLSVRNISTLDYSNISHRPPVEGTEYSNSVLVSNHSVCSQRKLVAGIENLSSVPVTNHTATYQRNSVAGTEILNTVLSLIHSVVSCSHPVAGTRNLNTVPVKIQSV